MATIENTTPTPRDRPPLASLFLFAVLLGIGWMLTWTGTHAIGARHYQEAWEQNGDMEIGPISSGVSDSHGIDLFNGNAAVLVGIGFIAFGAMLILWGLSGTWAVVRPSKIVLGRTISARLCILSMLLQTIALVCLDPPWIRGRGVGPALWITLALLGTITWVIATHGSDSPRKGIPRKGIVVGLIAAATGAIIATGGNQSWVGMVLGIFAALSYGGHYVFLHVLRSTNTNAKILVRGVSTERQSLPSGP